MKHTFSLATLPLLLLYGACVEPPDPPSSLPADDMSGLDMPGTFDMPADQAEQHDDGSSPDMATPRDMPPIPADMADVPDLSEEDMAVSDMPADMGEDMPMVPVNTCTVEHDSMEPGEYFTIDVEPVVQGEEFMITYYDKTFDPGNPAEPYTYIKFRARTRDTEAELFAPSSPKGADGEWSYQYTFDTTEVYRIEFVGSDSDDDVYETVYGSCEVQPVPK